MCDGETVIVLVPVTPEPSVAVAVIVTVPATTPVTTPEEFTVALDVSPEDHVTVCEAPVGSTVAVRFVVPPTPTVSEYPVAVPTDMLVAFTFSLYIK